MRILVTGAGGLLGGRLAAELHAGRTSRGQAAGVWAARHRGHVPAGLPCVTLELADPPSLAAALDAAQPDAVVHAAVLGDADRCEREPELAFAINARAAGQVATACRARGLGLVALSTDLVFDDHEEPIDEQAEPHPVQVYGRSKLAGERAVQDAHPDAAVVRVSLVYGRGHGARGTASESVLWALAAGARPHLLVDQWRAPVDAASLADLVSCLSARGLGGLWHASGPERLSRFELGQRSARIAGLDERALMPVDRHAMRFVAPRPANVSLDSRRAQSLLGWRPRPVAMALASSRLQADREPAAGGPG